MCVSYATVYDDQNLFFWGRGFEFGCWNINNILDTKGWGEGVFNTGLSRRLKRTVFIMSEYQEWLSTIR